MHTHRLLVRLVTWLATWLVAFFGLIAVLASSIVLNGPAVLVVLVPAAIAAAAVAGAQDERRAATACTAAALTALATLVVVGIGVLAGAVVAVLVTASGAVLGSVVWLVRRWLPWRASAGSGSDHPGDAAPSGGQASWAGWLDTSPTPAAHLSRSALSTEWRRTTAALRTRLTPAVRQAVVRRRTEVLDEIERRNPAGFARWLTAEASDGADPSAILDHGRTPGTDGP